MELVRLTDKDLVAGAARGDTGAFNLLVSRWERRLFNYAFRLTGNREDALDVCQDTFLKAFQQLHRLQDPSRFAGWLFTIARNYCLAHFRSRQRRAEDGEGPDPPGLDSLRADRRPRRLGDLQELEPAELRLLVEGALDRLSFEQREAVVLKVFEGLRFDEIAAIAGCPLSTAKSRMYLGLSRLKSILNEDPGRTS